MSETKGGAGAGAGGEKAAEEVKGGIKGLSNFTESIRHNINGFADGLVGGNKTHESTGFSNDAKATGKQVEQTVGGQEPAATSHTTPAGSDANVGSHATGQPVTDVPPTGKTA